MVRRWLVGSVGLVMACGGGSETLPETETGDGPTWHQDVAPIVVGHCTKCHADGEAGGFALDSYGAAAAWAPSSLIKIEGDTSPPYLMPPWFALQTEECTPPAPFAGDERLSTAEIHTFRAWVEAGTPEGDPATAAPLPTVEVAPLEDPQTLTADSPALLFAGDEVDMYRCTPLDPGLTDTGYITGLQVHPGDPEVVHHVAIFTDPTGMSDTLTGPDGSYPCFGTASATDERVLLAWAPGSDPMRVPEDAGLALPAGGKLVMQVHYHPSGRDTEDVTRLDVEWAPAKPRLTAEVEFFGILTADHANIEQLVDPPFEVPAGQRSHRETMRYPIAVPDGVDVRVWSVFSHMHLAGSDIKVTLEHPDEDVCLAHNPMWDFSWQRSYAYDAPFHQLPQVRDGDEVELRCTFDNTENNPVLMEGLAAEGIDGPIPFGAGDGTLDEMCLALVGIVY